MKDDEIIRLFFDRDEKAILETKNSYNSYLYVISSNILHDHEDVEECLDDTYLETWNTIPPQRPKIFSAFIGKICRNLSLNRYRFLHAQKRGGGEITVSFDELEECLSSDIKTEQSELSEIIDRFLDSLSVTSRRVFVCRYWYFDSISDIAERYAYSEGKVKMMLKRTRDKLRDYLIKEGVCDESGKIS